MRLPVTADDNALFSLDGTDSGTQAKCVCTCINARVVAGAEIFQDFEMSAKLRNGIKGLALSKTSLTVQGDVGHREVASDDRGKEETEMLRRRSACVVRRIRPEFCYCRQLALCDVIPGFNVTSEQALPIEELLS